MKGYSASIYYADDRADYSPEGCFYDRDKVAEISKKYRHLFGTPGFDSYIEEILVKDQFKYQLVTNASMFEDVNPEDPETYIPFDPGENGWEEEGLLLDKHGAATLRFRARNYTGTLEIALSFGGGDERPILY
jgi:hypothetical protein